MIVKLIFIFIITGLTLLLIPRLMTMLYAASRTQTVESVPPQRVAIVFGAGLWRDGSPTPVLRDRISTAAELYFAGKVEKLLMSGDNRFEDYNEPAAMLAYARSLGVPEGDIVLDYAGRRTYDTCYRARDIFGVSQAILITQGFHLPRALYTCNKLGVTAAGVSADQRAYRRSSLAFWHTRETIATLAAFLDVHILHPVPVLGEPEPIFSKSSNPTIQGN